MAKKVVVTKGKARVVNSPAVAPAEKRPEPRQFNEEEILELQELHRLVAHRQFEAKQVRGNTALIPDGIKVADQLEAMARLYTNTKQHWISQKLAECGWSTDQRVAIDMKTGLITPEGVVVPAKK